jgi:hypothetical protein
MAIRTEARTTTEIDFMTTPLFPFPVTCQDTSG